MQSAMKKTSEQFADTAHKASRAASAVVYAIEDSVGAARRAAKQGGDAAVELLDDTRRRMKQHLTETVVATFAAGIAVGAVLVWLMRRKQL